MEIKITKNPNPGQKPQDESKLGFGKVFTDHMFLYDWNDKEGWHDARIVPFGDLVLHPASTVFHYALEVFEGLKHIARHRVMFSSSDLRRTQSVCSIPQSVSDFRRFL